VLKSCLEPRLAQSGQPISIRSWDWSDDGEAICSRRYRVRSVRFESAISFSREPTLVAGTELLDHPVYTCLSFVYVAALNGHVRSIANGAAARMFPIAHTRSRPP
jgi:hypothetical protein